MESLKIFYLNLFPFSFCRFRFLFPFSRFRFSLFCLFRFLTFSRFLRFINSSSNITKIFFTRRITIIRFGLAFGLSHLLSPCAPSRRRSRVVRPPVSSSASKVSEASFMFSNNLSLVMVMFLRQMGYASL